MNYEYELIASIILIDYNFKEEIIFKVCLDEKSKVSPMIGLGFFFLLCCSVGERKGKEEG